MLSNRTPHTSHESDVSHEETGIRFQILARTETGKRTFGSSFLFHLIFLQNLVAIR